MLKLINLHLKVNFGLSALNWYRRHQKMKVLGALGIIFIFMLSIAPIFFIYLKMIQAIYTFAVPLGQPQLVLTSALVMSGFLVIFFGMVYIMSAFYFSRDLSFLVPLPLLPRDILAAKFTVVLINNYLTILPFLGPALWVYGYNQGEGLIYWLLGAVIFLLAPVIPLALVSAFVLLLMRVTNLGGRKDTLRLIGMSLFILLIFVFNIFVTSVPEGQEMEYLLELLSESQGLVNQAGRVFPPALWATRALTAGGTTAVLNLAAFTALSLAGIALMLFLGDRLFYRGLIGGEEVQARREITGTKLERKISRVSSPALAIAWREIKVLLRTPIYMFNSLAMLIVVPVIMLIPAFTAGGGIRGYLEMAGSADIRLWVNLGGAAFMGMMALFTPAASSSFSREGKQFWISKVIPVDPAEQIRGKVLYSFMIAFLAVPVLLIVSWLFIQWSCFELLLVFVLGMAYSFPAVTASLLIDLLRPYLTWDNPQKAIKQNLNVLAAMVVGAALLFAVFACSYFAGGAGLADYAVYLIFLAVSLLSGAIPYLIMLKIAANRFRSIDI